jgi:hypothetical protein
MHEVARRCCSVNGRKASVEDHDVMIPSGLEARLDLGCACRGLYQTAINKLHSAHHPRSTSFVPPSSTGASSHSIWGSIDLTRSCDPRLVEFEIPGTVHLISFFRSPLIGFS